MAQTLFSKHCSMWLFSEYNVHKCYTGLNQQQVDNHYYANARNLLSVTSIYGITNKIQVLLSDLQQGSTCFMWTSTPIPNKMSIMHSVGRMACTIAFNNPWPFSVIVHKLPHQKIHRSGDIILSQKPSKITVWIKIYVIHLPQLCSNKPCSFPHSPFHFSLCDSNAIWAISSIGRPHGTSPATLV